MKGKLSYHWIVVGALFVDYAASIGISTNAYNAISPAMMKDGLTASQVQTIPLVMTIAMMGLGLAIPALIKKLSFRTVTVGGTILLGVAMAMRTFSHSFGMMLFWAALQGAGFTCVCGVPVGIVLANWFHESRGTATGIAAAGSAIGGFAFVQLTNVLIQSMGWRTTNLIMAVISTALLLPVCMFILRETPEEKGLLPYGMEAGSAESGAEAVADNIKGITFGDFVRSKAFWLLCLTLFVLQFSTMGVYNNINIFLQTEAGHTAMFAGTVYAIVVLSQAPGKIMVGWLHDRFGVVIGSGYGLVLGIGFFVFLMMSGNPAMAVIMGVIFGMRNAMSSVMPPYMTAYIVGRRDYAKIFAVVNLVQGIGAALGPVFAGYLYDTMGSFNLAWIIFGVMFVVLFFISIITFKSGEGMDEM